jgi:LPS-assembly protein
LAVLAGLLALLVPATAAAQSPLSRLQGPDTSGEPVTFTAEEVEFDQNTDTVTARGRVEAWQGLRVLRAETFTYNRTTGVATAEGNVVLIEPDGQVLFAERAELTGGMRDAVLEGLRGHLAGNARVAAAGGRRTDGRITDLSRVVYSPCNLCPEDPDRPPLWQLRARIASLHSDENLVRYRDAAVEFGGWPLLWTPYLSHPAPGAPRATGFLSPTFGYTRLLGAFWSQPFYWAIDAQSDATVTTQLGTQQYGNIGAAYRRRFNDGAIDLEGTIGHLADDADKPGFGWSIFANGIFGLDENWRTGFSVNRASSRDYLRTYRYSAPQTLTSTAFIEGFWGAEGYARVDSRVYQTLIERTGTGAIPFVLPYGYAEWVFPTDNAGGRFTLDTQAYSLLRDAGTDSRRVGTRLGYEAPRLGRFGEIWTLRGQADLLAGWSNGVNDAPFFGPAGENGAWTNGNIRAALDMRWPLLRPAGEWGSQILEPRVQVVTGPSTGRQLDIPNEDSLEFEFTDANLFDLNRFAGRDRQEGGSRLDAALRGAWLFPNGGQLEGLVGRSFRASEESAFLPGSGVENRASDWVGRARIAPVPWFEVLGRGRLDGETGEGRLWDLTGTLFAGGFSVSGGYLQSEPAPNSAYRAREEVSLGGLVRVNENWRVGGFGRYDMEIDRPVAAQAVLAYEDECFIFETRFIRRWTQDSPTQRDLTGTSLLFRITLKTVGDFGIRAL